MTMTIHLPTTSSSLNPSYSISPRALQRWSDERLHIQRRPDGGTVYSFLLSGSTCNNMGMPIEVEMIVTTDADGRIESARSYPSANDRGCHLMCAANGNATSFFTETGECSDVIGQTIEQAAFREWDVEPSGCFCTAGNRRHKWRNVFQTLHYAMRGQKD
jgi:hypothetical protein